MAQIGIRTTIDKKQVRETLKQIFEVCKTEPNLSPRSLKEFETAYKNKRILLAVVGTKVIGWLLRIPYNENFQELAAGYISPPYRAKGVFRRLLEEAFSYSSKSATVTFNYSLADYLLKRTGFRKSSLWEAIKLSQGKFILNRLNLSRLKAIRKHYHKSKPIYLLYPNI